MVTISAPRLIALPADVEVTVVPEGPRFAVVCGSCGPLSSYSVEAAALEVLRWHHQQHVSSRTLHITFTPEEMGRLLAISTACAQDPEDLVRDILSQAIARPADRPSDHHPHAPHLRMVG